MTLWDDRLMEVIRKKGPSSAGELVDHQYIHVSKSTISRRLNKLADYELLDRLPNGVYRLTEKGENYLDGKLDAEQLNTQHSSSDESIQS
jgi:Mn-dependent DtxR family transcriptional regulator